MPKVMPAGARAPALWKNPLFRLGSILVTQLLGWPLYLLFNVGGRFYDRCVHAPLCVCCVCVCVRMLQKAV